MLKFRKGYNLKIIALIVTASFLFTTGLHSHPVTKESLRLHVGSGRDPSTATTDNPKGKPDVDLLRARELMELLAEQDNIGKNPDDERSPTITAQTLQLVSQYLSTQYSLPVYSGLTPGQIEALFEGYEFSESHNDPSVIIDAIQLIMQNNMRFNHMYIGHMLTTPLALPIFVNYLIDFINSNQADPDAHRIYQLIERQTIQWLAHMLGYNYKEDVTKEQGIKPDGVITSGGTTANMLSLVLMRDTAINNALRQAGYSENVCAIGLQRALELLGRDIVLFVSEEAHYSWEKMGGYEGIGVENVVGVEVDPHLKMDPEDLKRKVAQAKEDGKIILGIMATVGTTETGNIDPIKEIAEIAEKNNIWLHIDAAYGGGCVLSQRKELKQKMSYMHLADSVTIDPHKFLFIPYNLGAMIVKDSKSLEVMRPYFQEGNEGILAQSFIGDRRFDALKLWAALQWIGTKELGNLIDHVIRMTMYLYSIFEEDEDFETLSTPEMDLFTFRYIPPELHERLKKAISESDKKTINEINAKINRLTEAIQQALQDSGETWLSLTGMERSSYTRWGGASIQALRVDLMNAFISGLSVEACHGIVKRISEQVAREHREEWELRKILVTASQDKEPIPVTKREYPFQNYFMHPETREVLERLGRQIIELGSENGDRLGPTKKEIDDFEATLYDFNPPVSGVGDATIVDRLALIAELAGSQDGREIVPEVAKLGSLVYSALNPNQIAWEVSTASTYAEAMAIEWLAELFNYREYVVNLGGKTVTITPGGNITNSTTMADLTALLVARNIMMERLLRGYNEAQNNSSPEVSVTEQGYTVALDVVRKHVKRNDKTRIVIIASEQMQKKMQELALFIGMSPDDVVVAAENANGTVDAKSLQVKIDEERMKGNIVMMVAVSLGGMVSKEARYIKRIFRDCTYKHIWVHAVVGDSYRSSFDPHNKFMRSVLARVNSTTVNLQELFNMPYGLGVVLFQNKFLLEHYLKQSAPYVIREQEAGRILNLSGYSPEGSKGFQALQLFLMLLLFGENIKDAIHQDSVLQLGYEFTSGVQAARSSEVRLDDNVVLFHGDEVLARLDDFPGIYHEKGGDEIFVVIAEDPSQMEIELRNIGLIPGSEDLKVGTLQSPAWETYRAMFDAAEASEIFGNFKIIKGGDILDENLGEGVLQI